MKKNFILTVTLFVIAAASAAGCAGTDKKQVKEAEIKTDVYTCPMKCNNGQTYEKPGTCPQCGMELEKVTKS